MSLKKIIALLLILTFMGCFLPRRGVTLPGIEDAVKANVDCRLIVEKIDEKGVDFKLTAEIRRKLMRMRCGKNIINAIEKANKKSKNKY